jgi:hypothetical protein
LTAHFAAFFIASPSFFEANGGRTSRKAAGNPNRLNFSPFLKPKIACRSMLRE